MTDQLSDLIRIIGITILITFLWAASIAFTYWDVHQQRFPAGRVLLWLLLVGFLPLVGFILYISFRALTLLIPITNNGKGLKTRHGTALKRPLVKKNPMPTLLASDLAMRTVLEPQKVMQPDDDHPKSIAKCVLLISSGPDQGKEFIIDNFPARVGRGSEAVIRLDGDLGVSRMHAEIYDQEGMLRIRDLKSTHGTWVNGHRIEDQRLESSDQVQLGLTILAVKIIKEG